MLNKNKILELLDSWKAIVQENAKQSSINVGKLPGGLERRIKETGSQGIVIYDYPSYKKQCLIQDELCRLLPSLTTLINSKPNILDFGWKIGDYLELSYNHYNLVIEKIKKHIT